MPTDTLPEPIFPWGVTVPFTEAEQKKLMTILQFRWSLHEADQLYEDIFNPDVDEAGVRWLMEYYAENPENSEDAEERRKQAKG